MKKILYLLLSAIVLLSLCSCDASDFIWGGAIWDGHQRRDEVFYGVGDHIDELNNTCVLIPGIGHVSMPSLQDGTTPSFKRGDLIEITFKGVSGDFAIMECYPARFGGSADEIKVVPSNVELKTDSDITTITLDFPNELKNLSEGGSFVITTLIEDKNGKIVKDFAACRLVTVDDGRMTFTFDVDAKDLLRELMRGDVGYKISPSGNT